VETQEYLDKFIRCEGFLTQTNNKMKVFSDLSINYRLRTIQRGRDAKEQTIYCRIILKGNRLDISTKQIVSSVFWDKLTEKVKQKYASSEYINQYLESLTKQIVDIYLNHKGIGKELTMDEIKSSIFGLNVVKEANQEELSVQLLKNLLRKYREDLNLKGKAGVLAYGTFIGYKCSLLSFEEYFKKYYSTNSFSLKDISKEFFFKFETYLLTTKRLCKNSACRVLKHTRRVFNYAFDNGWIENRIDIRFGVRYTNPPRKVLSMAEIKHIEELEIESDLLKETRDVFIFACFTGLGFSELKSLSIQNYTELAGRGWILINRKKTGGEQKLVLLPVAKRIIERHKSNPYCIKNNQLLPIRNNAKCTNPLLLGHIC
jgi:integrase